MRIPTTIIDGLRRYGCWAGNPQGMKEDVTRCAAQVFEPSVWSHGVQCQRKRGHGSDGLLCKQHARMREPEKAAPAQTLCQTCDKPKCDRISPIKNEDENDQHHLDYFCHGHPPREGREDGERCDGSGYYKCDNNRCCFGPSEDMPGSDPHVCRGCDNCRNQEEAKCGCGYCDGKNCGDCFNCRPAHGAAKGEGWEKEFEALRYRFDYRGYSMSENQVDGIYRILTPFIRSLRSRSEKDGEARAWGKAVRAVPEKPECSSLLDRCAEHDDKDCLICPAWNSVRQAIIQAAKDDGHQVG